MLLKPVLSKNLVKTIIRSATSLTLCASIVACSDTTVGTRSFEETESFTIPGLPFSIGQVTLPPIGIPIDLAQQEAYNEGDFDFITSVKVRDIVFDIAPSSNDTTSDPLEDGNLDSFEFVSGLVLALQATIDGVEQTVQIADLPMNDPQIASNATRLVMNVNDEQDIRDLIEAPGGPTILITISGTNPPDNVDVEAKIRFRAGLGFR